MSESTDWELKTITDNDGLISIVYKKKHKGPYAVEVSKSSLKTTIDISNGKLLENSNISVRELRKLGMIKLDGDGSIPDKVELTGLGKQAVLWINNSDIRLE